MVNSYRPETFHEALALKSKKQLLIIAGGTDLMVKKRSWSNLAPTFSEDVLFVGQLEELNYIHRVQGENGSKIHIGATMTLEDLLQHEDTPEILRKALEVMASPAIRHTGTLAGNIGNASPAGDSLPVLYLLNAEIVLTSNKGERVLPIEEFILGPGKTAIESDEIIEEIKLDDVDFTTIYYKKVGGRKADAISKVCFAGCGISVNGQITDMRVAYGAVGPTIVRVKTLEEQFVKSQKEVAISKEGISKDAIHKEILEAYKGYIKPIDDQRSKAVYRKQIALNLLGDFLSTIK